MYALWCSCSDPLGALVGSMDLETKLTGHSVECRTRQG